MANGKPPTRAFSARSDQPKTEDEGLALAGGSSALPPDPEQGQGLSKVGRAAHDGGGRTTPGAASLDLSEGSSMNILQPIKESIDLPAGCGA